jgi:hypothetical protein
MTTTAIHPKFHRWARAGIVEPSRNGALGHPFTFCRTCGKDACNCVSCRRQKANGDLHPMAGVDVCYGCAGVRKPVVSLRNAGRPKGIALLAHRLERRT